MKTALGLLKKNILNSKPKIVDGKNCIFKIFVTKSMPCKVKTSNNWGKYPRIPNFGVKKQTSISQNRKYQTRE